MIKLCLSVQPISIHAPREGGDIVTPVLKDSKRKFQSTPPARGATGAAGADGDFGTDFNPRPPRGGRHTRQN